MGREERARKKSKQSPRPQRISHHVPIAGLAGERERLLINNRFPIGDPRNDVPVGGGLGKYRVILTLARPGYLPVSESEFSFDPDIPGDSHLAIAAPAVTNPNSPNDRLLGMEIEFSSPAEGQMIFACKPNSRGFLGRIETELNAASFHDAELKAYRSIAPALSNWSAQLDIPIHVWRILVVSTDTGSIQINCINPFAEAMTGPGNSHVTPEFASFVSLYREALESNSAIYQFLCLFKMAEGLTVRRARLAKEAKSRGEQFSRPVELVPEVPADFEPWLNAVFPNHHPWNEMAFDSVFVQEAQGRKCGDLLKNELKDVRDAVAHALSDATGTMAISADEELHLRRVNKWLPLTKCIVRRMLKNEFPTEFLPGRDGE